MARLITTTSLNLINYPWKVRGYPTSSQPRSSLFPQRSEIRVNGFVKVDKVGVRKGTAVKASCSLNAIDDVIVQEALKEPVAFMGGMFAGLLRLDLNDDPLKEWLTRTVEASGISEEIDAEGSKTEEETPQQIEIE